MQTIWAVSGLASDDHGNLPDEIASALGDLQMRLEQSP